MLSLRAKTRVVATSAIGERYFLRSSNARSRSSWHCTTILSVCRWRSCGSGLTEGWPRSMWVSEPLQWSSRRSSGLVCVLSVNPDHCVAWKCQPSVRHALFQYPCRDHVVGGHGKDVATGGCLEDFLVRPGVASESDQDSAPDICVAIVYDQRSSQALSMPFVVVGSHGMLKR